MTNDFNKTENDSTKTRIDKWQIIDEEFISYTGGTAQLISNGECKVHLWETPKDAQLFCDKLNELNNENQQLRIANENLNKEIQELQIANHTWYKENVKIINTIQELYNAEKTTFGKNILKQVLEAIQ